MYSNSLKPKSLCKNCLGKQINSLVARQTFSFQIYLMTVPGTQGFIILSDITFNYNVYQGEGVISSTGEYLHVETPSGWPPGHMSSCTTSSFLSVIFFGPVGRPQTSATCRWKTTCRWKMAPRMGGFLISVT